MKVLDHPFMTCKITNFLISTEDIASDATLDVKVWDADKVKPDDEWGCHSTPVRDIVCAKLDDLGNIVDWDKNERVILDG